MQHSSWCQWEYHSEEALSLLLPTEVCIAFCTCACSTTGRPLLFRSKKVQLGWKSHGNIRCLLTMLLQSFLYSPEWCVGVRMHEVGRRWRCERQHPSVNLLGSRLCFDAGEDTAPSSGIHIWVPALFKHFIPKCATSANASLSMSKVLLVTEWLVCFQVTTECFAACSLKICLAAAVWYSLTVAHAECDGQSNTALHCDMAAQQVLAVRLCHLVFRWILYSN